MGIPDAPAPKSVPLRVVIADDTLLIREGVQRLLETTEGIEIVAVAESLDELLLAVDAHKPDVVVTDIRMPPTSTDEGIRAAAILRRSSPDIGVVVLSQYAEPSYALDLFSSGVSGRAYLLKDRISEPGEIANAVFEVAAKGSVTDASIVELLVSSARSMSDPLADLTPREQEVLAGIAQGKNNGGIAKALGISDRAVERHINSLFPKLGLHPESDVNRRVMAVLLFLDSERDHR